MPDIKDSVGDGGTNRVHDVALVQAMLRLVKDAKGVPFLNGNYDGSYGNVTKSAITRFQKEYKLIPEKAPVEKLGLMAAAGPSNQKLSELLPEGFRDLRIIADTRTVYLAADEADATSSHDEITAYKEFETTFQGNVATLVNDMFETHKIALWVTDSGWRRTFAEQANPLLVTNAGPGESNHNFGRAVDLGFRNFRWLRGNGTVKQDADWLNSLQDGKATDAGALWDARDALATSLGLFRLNMERIHLQSYDQKTVSSQRSLASLLDSAGTMGWSWKGSYFCDLGSEGKHWAKVGSAKQIWALNSTLTKGDIAKALTATTGAVVKELTVKVQQVVAMKKALKADFQAAEDDWASWAGVP